MLLRLAAGLCLALAAPAAVIADDLVREVRDGHRAARESIRTLSAVVTVEKVHPTRSVTHRGRYSRSGSTVRIHEDFAGGGTDDVFLKGGEIREFNRGAQAGRTAPKVLSAFRRPQTAGLGPCDAWENMLIELTGPDGPLDLDRTLETSTRPVRADRDTVDGRACVRLRLERVYPSTGARQEVTLWHDIGRNYLVCKLTSAYPDEPSAGTSTLRVMDYIEPSPGVVFPVQVRREYFVDGKLASAAVATLSEVEINKPIPAAALALPAIPSGTVVRDEIEGKEGPVDSDWRPLGPPKPLTQFPTPAQQAPAAVAEGAPSTSEPVSSAGWVLYASAGVLVAAVGVVVVRRVRAARQTDA
ncbi:MAG: hypothetical protein K2X82_30285 [Gemmataceae bacterium]|nr:hypothetical protein [Gemmataceae bacterium]